MADGIDLNIEYMYQAAKELIPDKADQLADVAKRLRYHLQAFDSQAALAGDPAVLRNLLKAGDQTFDALRIGVISLNNAAESVLKTAQDLAGTDHDAGRDFRHMDATLDGVPLVSVGVTPAPVPDDNGDPSQPGAPRPDDQPSTGGHPTQGGTASTPDPVAPADEIGEHDVRQQEEQTEHPYASEQV